MVLHKNKHANNDGHKTWMLARKHQNSQLAVAFVLHFDRILGRVHRHHSGAGARLILGYKPGRKCLNTGASTII